MPVKTFPNIKASFLTVSPDGSYMVSEIMNTVQVWNRTATAYEPGIVLNDFIASGLFVNGFAISYDGNLLIVVSSDFMLHVFKRKDGSFKKIQTISDYEGLPWHHSFTPDGKYYMCATSGGEGILWKITEDELVKVSVLKEAMDFHFSPDGELAYADGKILSFRNEKFVQLQVFDASEYSPKLVNFSPDGNYLAVFGTPPGDDAIFLFKKTPGGVFKKTGTLIYEDRDPEFIEFSADSRFLASYDHHANSGRKKIMIYEISNDSLVYKMAHGAFTDNMEKFQFINNGTQAVSGSFREVIIYTVQGVKGNKFYKAGVPSVAANTSEVKKDEKPKTNEVKTQPTGNGTTINIFWINPNPDVMDGKPVVSEKGSIDIQVKIISNKKIGKEDIKIIINGKEMGKSNFNEVGFKESAPEEFF